MRILAEDQDLLFAARPFEGDVGVSLYVGVVDPANDPGPTAIVHCRKRSLNGGGDLLAYPRQEYDLGAASVPKTPRIASAESPDAELSLTIPAAWHDKAVWLQLRTFADDLENETLYRPRRLLLTTEGDLDEIVSGTATLLSTQKRDAGGLLVKFRYNPSREGLQPTQFLLRQLTGTGTITDGSVDYVPPFAVGDLGQQLYEVEVTGLTDAAAYTFALLGTDGTTQTELIASIPFTADAAGPPAVSGLTAIEK